MVGCQTGHFLSILSAKHLRGQPVMGIIERELKLRVERAKLKHLEALVEINKAAAPKWHRRQLLKSALQEKRAFIAFMGRIPAGFLIWTKDFYSHHFIDLV